MIIKLTYKTRKPLHEQIADCIRTAIYDGTLKDGDKLPSIRELTRKLPVSDITVKRAYYTLKSEGLVHSISGRGTFVYLRENWRELRESSLLAELSVIAEELCKLGTTKEKLLDCIQKVYEKE